jgi:hypothetical protein
MTNLTKKELRDRFLTDFLRRLRQAPPGTRLYMAAGDLCSKMPRFGAFTKEGELVEPIRRTASRERPAADSLTAGR